MRTKFVRALFLACAFFSVIFVAEFLFEWNRLGRPGTSALSWQGASNAKLVDLLSPMARAYNNILAMLLATIGLAIPLTANMHAPKLIDMFFRDRLNQVVLFAMAFGAANDIYIAYVIGPGFAPMWSIRFVVFFALFGWAMLIPYFFYVIRFLDPSNILARLKEEINEAIQMAHRGELNTELAQDIAHERIYQIGTIILKSLDRADRGVALEGVWTLKLLLDAHARVKKSMPDAWFVVDRKDFIGLGSEAIDLLNEQRVWFEMKLLTQLFLAYQQALSKTSDVVSCISDAVRVIAEGAARRGDEPCLNLSIRFFNNFVREAVKKQDLHAMSDVFYEYRLLARDLADHPKSQRAIARHVRHYARAATARGTPFVEQLAAFELGYITRRAYEVKSPAAPDLLTVALSVSHGDTGAPVMLVVKAKLLLGSFFIQHGLEAEALVVQKDLAGLGPSTLFLAERELLEAEQCFFEVTDRQENIEYVRPERREPLKTFVRALTA